MTLPVDHTATPDPDDTTEAEVDNPAEGGNDANFGEEQAGLDPDVVTPVTDASKDEEKDKLENTDLGDSGN